MPQLAVSNGIARPQNIVYRKRKTGGTIGPSREPVTRAEETARPLLVPAGREGHLRRQGGLFYLGGAQACSSLGGVDHQAAAAPVKSLHDMPARKQRSQLPGRLARARRPSFRFP